MPNGANDLSAGADDKVGSVVGTFSLLFLECPEFYDRVVSLCPGFQIGKTLTVVTVFWIIEGLLYGRTRDA